MQVPRSPPPEHPVIRHLRALADPGVHRLG